jgi:2-phosphoglycerate kinase
MAGVNLVVVGPEGERPFMRGILVQSLVYRGVPFEVALDTANRVRKRLSGRSSVEANEIARLVEDMLGDELEARPPAPSLPPLVRGGRGSGAPFSKGILAVSLQGAGLEPSEAHDVAREIESQLLASDSPEIERSALRELVSEVVERSAGARAAERYRVWRSALEDDRPIFVLIGGSSGVGKTSIAVEVARRLEIPRVIGTDSIRQIMRLMFSSDLMPEIHCSTFDAWHALGLAETPTADSVIAGFREQAQKIAVGVQALLDRAVQENSSLLIEGVNLLPGLIDLERYAGHAHCVFVVVAMLDPEGWRSRFKSRAARARERQSDRYLHHLAEIREIQDHVLREADHASLPIIDNVQFDQAVAAAVRSVIASLKKSLIPPVERRT